MSTQSLLLSELLRAANLLPIVITYLYGAGYKFEFTHLIAVILIG